LSHLFVLLIVLPKKQPKSSNFRARMRESGNPATRAESPGANRRQLFGACNSSRNIRVKEGHRYFRDAAFNRPQQNQLTEINHAARGAKSCRTP
jgi:hypothetical protein